MSERNTHASRLGWVTVLFCICFALLVAGIPLQADEAQSSSTEPLATEASDESPSESASADAESHEADDESPQPLEIRRETGKKADDASKAKDENEGSVDIALRKLATIPRPNVRRHPGADRDRTVGSTQYRLPSGTKVIVIQPGPQAGDRGGNDASPPDLPRHSDGGVSEPNNLGLQHRDAIRDSVSSLPIGDDINGEAPDWQSEVIEGQIVDRNDPRLRNATMISGPYSPYRPGYSRAYNDGAYTNVRPDDTVIVDGAPAQGRYYRFGFVPETRIDRLHAKANARTDRLLNSADKFRARGIANMREGRYRQAADAFKLSAETNHHDPAARLYAAHAYFAIGRYREAVEFLDRAFELQPRIAFLNYDLRDDYGRKADFDRHLSDLERALDRSPHDVDRLTLLGYVLCFSNQRDIAWQPLVKACKHAPDNALVHRLLEPAQPPDVELEKAGIILPERD